MSDPQEENGMYMDVVPPFRREAEKIRMQYLPEGIAGLWLRAKAPNCSLEDIRDLAEWFKTYWRGGYDAAMRGEPRQ